MSATPSNHWRKQRSYLIEVVEITCKEWFRTPIATVAFLLLSIGGQAVGQMPWATQIMSGAPPRWGEHPPQVQIWEEVQYIWSRSHTHYEYVNPNPISQGFHSDTWAPHFSEFSGLGFDYQWDFGGDSGLFTRATGHFRHVAPNPPPAIGPLLGMGISNHRLFWVEGGPGTKYILNRDGEGALRSWSEGQTPNGVELRFNNAVSHLIVDGDERFYSDGVSLSGEGNVSINSDIIRFQDLEATTGYQTTLHNGVVYSYAFALQEQIGASANYGAWWPAADNATFAMETQTVISSHPSIGLEVWRGGTGSPSWSDPNNWGGQVPNELTNVVFDDEGPYEVNLTGELAKSRNIDIANGEISLSGGGSRAQISGSVYVGRMSHAELQVNSGVRVDAQNYMTIGGGSAGSGAVRLDGATLNVGQFSVIGGEGTGLLELTNGSRLTTGTLQIGLNQPGFGKLAANGSTVSVGELLYVGRAGFGELAIENGSVVSANAGLFGEEGGRAVISISGNNSQLFTSYARLGASGDVKVNVSDGGHLVTTITALLNGSIHLDNAKLSGWELGIGGFRWLNAGGNLGQVTLSGNDAIADIFDLRVAPGGDWGNSKGVLSITDGARMFVGNYLMIGSARSIGEVSVSGLGSQLEVKTSGNLDIGLSGGYGSLGVYDRGMVKVDRTLRLENGRVEVINAQLSANQIETKGVFFVGQGGAAHCTSNFILNAGEAEINGSLNVGQDIILNGGIMTGSGTLTASSLVLNGGTFTAGGSFANGVSVNAGVLGGGQRLAGNVTVGSAATLAPGNSPGTITIDGNLILNGQYEWDVDPLHTSLADLAVVNGDFTWNGTLNIVAQNGGIGIGQSYTLFAYSGTFFGSFSPLAGYLIQIGESAGGLNAHGLGNGYSYINITAVPEPGTCLPLGIVACWMLSRTRIARRRHRV